MAMEATLGLARPELIQVADTVAREKGIDREEVIVAMEQAIQKAGRSKYGHEHDIRADINRKSGEITLVTRAHDEATDSFREVRRSRIGP